MLVESFFSYFSPLSEKGNNKGFQMDVILDICALK